MARDTFSRVSQLIERFPIFLEVFLRDPPFKRPEQLDNHLATINLRRSIGNASDAVRSDKFLESLYFTLQAWGIGMRGSKLKPLPEFREAVRERSDDITALDGIEIDNTSINPTDLVSQIWDLISSLNIVTNDTPVVSGTKALHHILPDLVVPIDRAYTQKFFGWQNPEFQYGQAKVFSIACKSFIRIARKIDLAQYVGESWCSSKTKVIDNAIVGFISAEKTGI